jgi:hypothetical protein
MISRSTKLMLWSMAGLLAGTLADSAQAQIVINGAGSSAGRQFAGGAPIAMCLNEDLTVTPIIPKPVHLRNGTTDTGSDRHTWICNVTYAIPALGINFINQPAVIRYSASESGDGYIKLTGQYNSTTTAPYILDQSTCNPTPVSQTVSGITFDEYSSCTQQSQQTVNFGASDVQAGSFGQAGPNTPGAPIAFPPSCSNPASPPDCGTPVNDSLLSSEPVAALPFALFVNNGVRLQTPAGALGGVLNNLTRPQIEAIFRRNVRDWDELGYLVTSNGTTPDATETGVTLCLREAGSGSKAAFDQTMMIQSGEANVANNAINGTGGTVIYSPTSSGVVTCVNNNVNGIGYLNAESSLANAHVVQINGTSANYAVDPANTSPIARKRDIACGRYDFWVDWRVIRVTANDGTAANNMVRVFADAAKTRTNSVPSGSHWVAQTEMNVSKALDAGPISVSGGLNPPANPECRP